MEVTESGLKRIEQNETNENFENNEPNDNMNNVNIPNTDINVVQESNNVEIKEENLPYNEKCDLWSLGVTLHELYFGLLPYGPSANMNLNTILENPKTKSLVENLDVTSKNIAEISMYINDITKDEYIHNNET